MNRLLSFVIPCYGSELTIESVIDEIIGVVAQRDAWDYEIICVNDGSPDGVLNILCRMASENPRITVVDLAKNMGKHSAIMAGYLFVRGELIVNLDDDGQCPMDRLWDLVDAVDAGHDVASAKYYVKRQSRFKNFGSAVNFKMSQWLLEKPADLHMENFSVFRRFIVDEMLRYRNAYPYIEGLILRATRNIVNVEMDQRERIAGTGGFTFRKAMGLWMNGFTAFSVKPLRLSTYIGFLSAGIGFVYGLYVIIQHLLNSSQPMGYSSTMSVLLFIGGLILFALGLIGEYVGRIYISINSSPQYVIRGVVNDNKGNGG